MKVVTKQEIKDMINSGELVRVPKQDHKPIQNPPLSKSVYPIMMEYDISEYLIKVNNHYVPAEYLFYLDSGQEKDNYVDDKHAALPKIEYNGSKYSITFDGPDFGGYDVTSFTWYFDSVEDIIKEMRTE